MKKNEIWLANLNPGKGTEPGKIRPVVIIQTNLLNDVQHPSTIICPITSQTLEKENKLRVKLGSSLGKLTSESEILVDQIRAIDNRRFTEKLGDLPQDKKQELRMKIGIVLDF